MRRGLLCLGILYAAVGTRGWASAQNDSETARSQRLFAAALEAKRAQELPRALCLMQQAQLAWSDPAFSFNVAQLQRELGMCADAQLNYQAFLEHERDPARRQQAERALAELGQCAPNASQPAPLKAAASHCASWVEAVLGVSPPPPTAAVVPSPVEVARASAQHVAPPMAAAKRGPPRRAKSSVAQALPWVFAGVGIVCVGLAGYELAQISAAERASENTKHADMFAAQGQEGRHSQTMFWVFSGAGTLALSSALVLALVGNED